VVSATDWCADTVRTPSNPADLLGARRGRAERVRAPIIAKARLCFPQLHAPPGVAQCHVKAARHRRFFAG